MAHKQLVSVDIAGGNLAFVYNLDFSVGPNQPNRKDDVQLVQLCLQQIYTHPTVGAGTLPGGYKIETDGSCGPITRNAIWHIQTYLQRISGGQVYADGVIGPITLPFSSGRYVRSLIWMNWLLMRAIGPGRFEGLPNDSITPTLLQERLSTTVIIKVN